MKKIIFIIIATLFFNSMYTSSENKVDTWYSKEKQMFIQKWNKKLLCANNHNNLHSTFRTLQISQLTYQSITSENIHKIKGSQRLLWQSMLDEKQKIDEEHNAAKQMIVAQQALNAKESEFRKLVENKDTIEDDDHVVKESQKELLDLIEVHAKARQNYLEVKKIAL